VADYIALFYQLATPSTNSESSAIN